ncbi:zinc finger MYM-type protein 1-like [Myzus persicae]|uniref:zinc finger MYM-type protein 1-like n=1 Tax=Myzus persicae TaxID=13164 RepID=UPI000B936F12|nr:zinc finger MYM-type protein 1-like [Myzus persicae]
MLLTQHFVFHVVALKLRLFLTFFKKYLRILMGKDWHSVLSVCFDDASTMAGKIGGVQTKCKEQYSSIKYVHCYAHCLNLALVDSVCDKSKNSNRNKLVFNFFGTIQFIYNFIESSAMRHAILEKISKDVGIKLLTLKSCSITRWVCRAEAVKSVLNNYEVLLLAIEEICESSSVLEMCAKGMGLKYQLKNFDFIFGLYLLNPILNSILKTSSLLQSPNMDLVLAINSVQSLVQNLEAMRNNDL